MVRDRDMTGIVLAHGKAAETVRRHVPNWEAAFDELLFVSPADDAFPGARGMGRSERSGSDAIERMKFAVHWAASKSAATIFEYDTLFFTGKIPDHIVGENRLISSVLKGDTNPQPGLIVRYGHSPWMAGAATWRRILGSAGDEQMGWPDRWLAVACRQAGIEMLAFDGAFSDDNAWTPAILSAAAEAVRFGAPVVHGAKSAHDWETIVAARREFEQRVRPGASGARSGNSA
jgi:hypothetical protein